MPSQSLAASFVSDVFVVVYMSGLHQVGVCRLDTGVYVSVMCMGGLLHSLGVVYV